MVKTKRRKKVVVVQDGEGFMDFLKDANKWLRKSKFLSKSGKVLSRAGVPYAGPASEIAGLAGYGRKRKKRRATKKSGISV